MSFSIQSVYNWYRDTIRNPKYRWWLILGTIVYLISPLDISPDFLPFVGQLDDIALVTLLVAEVSQVVVEYFKSRQINTEVDHNSAQESVTINTDTVEVKATAVNQ